MDQIGVFGFKSPSIIGWSDSVFVSLEKSLENAKDAFDVFRLNSNAVVADGKPPFVLPLLCRHVNHGRNCVAELHSVTDQVLK